MYTGGCGVKFFSFAENITIANLNACAGYNSVLGAIAINGIFYRSSLTCAVIALVNSLICAVFSGAVGVALQPIGQPTMT